MTSDPYMIIVIQSKEDDQNYRTLNGASQLKLNSSNEVGSIQI